MSMLDGFFNKGFKAAKCKTLLKLTIPRIKLLRNRREIQLKQMRRDIAKLLENGQEATARIRVEHIIREENMMAAQEIIELFCELIAVRLPIIETQRECPLDLKEAISSICFAAPRCSDLPELQQVQMLFAAKYGKEFVQAAAELMPDCGVNRQVIELLSVRAPSVEVKMKLLKEIAEEHELDWDPAASESEYLKPHEDLLNGPNHFISGSTVPPPQEKHDESVSSNPVKEPDEETDTDIFESLDLPEVPRGAVRGSTDTSPATETAPVQPAAKPDQSKSEHGVVRSISLDKVDTSHVPYGEPDEIDSSDTSPAFPYVPPKVTPAEKNKQFIPFVSSPSLPYALLPVKQSEPPSSVPKNKSESNLDSALPPSDIYTVKQSETTPLYSRTKDETNVDLQDVLAAAHAAAESAERAAAAARAAASLAQVRISELVTRRNDKISGSSDNEPQMEHPDQLDAAKPKFDQQSSFGHNNHTPYYEPTWSSESPTLASPDAPKMVVESLDSEHTPEHLSAHQPQRLSSLDDDPYFSYPNLFTSQDSGLKPSGQSFT